MSTAIDTKIVDDLAPLELGDWRGESVQLAELWRDRPVVVSFVRHFG